MAALLPDDLGVVKFNVSLELKEGEFDVKPKPSGGSCCFITACNR